MASVTVRFRVESVAKATTFDDLEIEQASRQSAHADDYDESEDEEARQAPDGLGAVVEEDAHQSIRSASAWRSWMEIARGPISAARIVSYTTPGSSTETGSATGMGVRRAL